MKTLKSILFAGAVLLATSLFFGSCQEDAPEINYQMNVNVNNDFSQVVKAINDGLLKNEQAIDRLKQAIDNMNGDQKAKLEAIEKVLASMTDSLNTKLLVIEAAIKSQSMELSLKLEAIERAINNLPRYNDVFDGIKGEIANLVQAVKDGTQSEKEALDEIIQKFEELKAAIHPDPYVDLALPSGTLWATCNLGAKSPEEFGDYYAWGETVPKTEFRWDNYKWIQEGLTLPENTEPKDFYPYYITKYQREAYGADMALEKANGAIWYDGDGNFIGDNKEYLEPADDAATAVLGAPWRIPSQNDYEELQKYCTFKEITQNGVDGFKITGRNGNSIFVPKAGFMEEYWLANKRHAYFWGKGLSEVCSSAQIMKIEKPTRSYRMYRYRGVPIRPVRSNVTAVIPDGPTNN